MSYYIIWYYIVVSRYSINYYHHHHHHPLRCYINCFLRFNIHLTLAYCHPISLHRALSSCVVAPADGDQDTSRGHMVYRRRPASHTADLDLDLAIAERTSDTADRRRHGRRNLRSRLSVPPTTRYQSLSFCSSAAPRKRQASCPQRLLKRARAVVFSPSLSRAGGFQKGGINRRHRPRAEIQDPEWNREDPVRRICRRWDRQGSDRRKRAEEEDEVGERERESERDGGLWARDIYGGGRL